MATGKFRTRSEYIEAVKLTAQNIDEVAYWCGGQKVEEKDPDGDITKDKVGLNIATMEGTARVSEGDWVVREANRRFWKMNDFDFQAKYIPF